MSDRTTATRIVDLRADDGVWLAMRWFPARGARHGAVLAMHAMMANASTFDRPRGKGFASHLAEQGFDTFCLDFRGHGLSELPVRGWTLDDYAGRDVPAALARITALSGTPAADVAWIGHSLGGIVSLATLARGAVPPPPALVLAATNIWRHPTLVRRLVVEVFDGSARLLGRAPIRALGIGTDDEPASYTAHLARWVRTGRFTSADGRLDYDAALPTLRLPVLTIFGTGDPLCRPSDARDLTRRLTAATHVERSAPGATHFSLWSSPEARAEIPRFLRSCL